MIAQLRDGGTVRLGGEAIALSGIAHIDVHSARGGYRVTPLERPAGSAVRLVATRPQPSAPTPGPTAPSRCRTAAGGDVVRGAHHALPGVTPYCR